MPETDVVDKLQALKPIPHHLVVIVDGDEEARTVPVPNIRKRWARIAGVLSGLEWSSVEARSKAGETLAMFKRTDDDDELTALDADAAALGGGGVTVREAQLIQLVTVASDRACARVIEASEKAALRYERMFGSLVAGVRGQLETIALSQRLATAQYHQALAVQQGLLRDATDRQGDDEQGDDGDPLAPLLRVVDKLGAGPASKVAPKATKIAPKGKGADRPQARKR